MNPDLKALSALPSNVPNAALLRAGDKAEDALEQAGLSAVQAYHILSRDLAGIKGYSVSLKLDNHFITTSVTDSENRPVLTSRKHVNSEASPDVDNGAAGLSVEDVHRGRGLGRVIVRNQLELDALMGRQKVTIDAGSVNGGYSWARFGFLPVSEGDTAYKRQFERDLIARIVAYEDYGLIPDGQAGHFFSLARLENPENIWELADQTQDVLPGLSVAFGREANKSHELRRSFNNIEIFNMDRAVNRTLENEQPFSLGKALLLRTQWKGEIDFDNPTQMKRVSDYTGGFAFLKPNW